MTNNAHPVLLHSQTIGVSGADNVVILHGLFGDLNNWKAMANRLSAEFQVHCMDLRNHGASPHSDGMTYAQMAADVAFTCEQLQITRTHLIGHSMGGKAAMQLALASQHTDLIERLVVVDISPRRYEHHHNSIIEGLQALAASAPASRGEADKLLEPYVAEAAIRSFLLKNLKRTDAGDYRLRINIDEIALRYDDIADAVSSDHKFDKPTLFIKGIDSNYLTEKDRAPINALFSAPAIKTIDGAGHWPHSEKPDVLFKVLSDFLQPA